MIQSPQSKIEICLANCLIGLLKPELLHAVYRTLVTVCGLQGMYKLLLTSKGEIGHASQCHVTIQGHAGSGLCHVSIELRYPTLVIHALLPFARSICGLEPLSLLV
jgi:hypothetical protein